MSTIIQIDAPTLKAWLDNDEVVLVDVREQHEYDAAHIEGCTLVPVGTCSALTVPEGSGKKMVFYCKAGVRGGRACEACAGELPDSQTVYNLTGGIDAWIAQGYPTVSA